MGSIGANKVTDVYFKTDWEPGTGPNSASFKNALAMGKRWMESKGYSFSDLVESVAAEHYLNTDESALLEDKLKIYAINNVYYTREHNAWREELERRGIKIMNRRTI